MKGWSGKRGKLIKDIVTCMNFFPSMYDISAVHYLSSLKNTASSKIVLKMVWVEKG